MPDISKDTTAPITLPAACPWGMVVYAETGEKMVQANEHMHTHYFDANADAVTIQDHFRFRLEGGWSTILQQLESNGNWTGRVVPLLNQHGISSVEVMMHLDPTVPGRLWLYTMEHPTVNGALRFSSRSEMKILQVLLDNTLEYVFLRDTNGRFIITNSSFRSAVAGGGAPSPVGETLSTFISDESAA